MLKRKTKELHSSSKCVDLEVNVEKTKYMFMSCQHTVGQYNNTWLSNSLEHLEEFEFLKTTLTNRSFMHLEIKN